jgi:ubiquinone biosynthesis protein Coq4
VILVVGCFKIIKNPYDTDVVIRAAQGLATPERFKVSQDFLRALPGGEEIFLNKPLLPAFNVDELLKYPEETLGHKFAVHMKTNNLDPDFFDVKFNDNISYSFYRYGKIHDVLHVVTGFDTSIAGEIGVLSYSFAQSRGPGALMIASLAMLHGVFFKPHLLADFTRAFVKGWQLGENSQSYHITDWNDLMKRPLSEARQIIGLTI